MDDNYQTQPQTQPQNTQQDIQPLEPLVPSTPSDSQAPSDGGQPISEEPTQPPIEQVQPTQPVQNIDDQIANMSNEEVVANFAKGLLIEKNLGEMDEDTEKDMIQDLVERINDFINRAVLESLPKEKLDELDDMIENDTATPEAVAQLIQDSGIDASAAAVKAMEKFREVYLGADVKQEA